MIRTKYIANRAKVVISGASSQNRKYTIPWHILVLSAVSNKPCPCPSQKWEFSPGKIYFGRKTTQDLWFVIFGGNQGTVGCSRSREREWAIETQIIFFIPPSGCENEWPLTLPQSFCSKNVAFGDFFHTFAKKPSYTTFSSLSFDHEQSRGSRNSAFRATLGDPCYNLD